jgi:monoamine oxidase
LRVLTGLASAIMPQTPLLQGMHRAIRLSRAARRAGLPLGELCERESERRLTRRALFEAAVGAAGAALLPACENDVPVTRDETGGRVIIIGGGLSGLHAAYRLRKVGIFATVHEAAKRFGGRLHTDRSTFPDGMHAELGGEFIDSGHKTMHALATELGIELLDYTNDDASLDGMVGSFGGKRLGSADFLAGFSALAAKIDEALAVIQDPTSSITYRTPNGAEGLDALSIRGWLDGTGITDPVRDLLEVAYVCEYGLDADQSNALNLLRTISTDATKFSVFGESDRLFHAKAGSDVFADELVKKLDPTQLVPESRLVALRTASDGTYRVTFEQGASTLELIADHVVLALPFSLLRNVTTTSAFSAQKLQAIKELGYGASTKLMCGFTSRPWRGLGSNGSTFTDAPYQSTWETSRLQPGASGILTNLTGGARAGEVGAATADENAAAFLDEIDSVFAGTKAASNGKAVQFAWTDYEFAMGGRSAWKVGQYTTIAGTEIEREDNVHFCGEHTSVDFQGSMEGAALTGAMAADEISQDFGLLGLAVARRTRRARTV